MDVFSLPVAPCYQGAPSQQYYFYEFLIPSSILPYYSISSPYEFDCANLCLQPCSNDVARKQSYIYGGYENCLKRRLEKVNNALPYVLDTTETNNRQSVPEEGIIKRPRKRNLHYKKRCKFTACTKFSQGRTDFCVRHGGGKRCEYPNCKNGARGKSSFCIGHGGGKRCQCIGCTKSAVGTTHFCVAHGGGRRCAHFRCLKSAQGTTKFCVAHGGGKRCKFPNCSFGARGSIGFCKRHSREYCQREN